MSDSGRQCPSVRRVDVDDHLIPFPVPFRSLAVHVRISPFDCANILPGSHATVSGMLDIFDLPPKNRAID